VETVFLNPYGELSLCTNDFYVTVTASDPQGVRSVSAFYSVNGVEGSEISMQFDSGAYYGLTSMAGEFSTNDKVSFSFVAYDGLGIRSTSGTYSAVITSCLGLQQAKAHV
jgi:hypothetical protein